MTPPPTMIGNLTASRLMRHPWRRRAVIVLLALVFGLLALFPQRYRAATTLMPTDPSNLGLSGALGQLGAFSGVFGNQAAVEVGLRVARSRDVQLLVLRKLDLVRLKGFSNEMEGVRWLEHVVDIRALRAGILQVEVKDRDPQLGLRIVSTVASAMRTRVSQISREQTSYKRAILVDLLTEATARLGRAQTAYDDFRRRTRYSAPGSAIEAIGDRVPQLQQQIKALEVEVRAARSFATDENMAVRQLLAQIQALREQLAQAQSLDASNPDSVNRVVTQSTQVRRLQQELGIAQTLYDSYKRFLEGTSVEDLTSSGNLRILEPAYIDTERQFDTLPLALCLLILVIGGAMEAYLIRLPVGAGRRFDDARDG